MRKSGLAIGALFVALSVGCAYFGYNPIPIPVVTLAPAPSPTPSAAAASTHPSTFQATHGSLVVEAGSVPNAKFDAMPCMNCHTAMKAFDGSIPANPSAAAGDNTCFKCHAGGPDGNPGHPTDYVATHGTTVKAAGGFQDAKVNGIACSSCHATAKNSDGTIPSTNPEKRAGDNTCFKCHVGGPDGNPHASTWESTHGKAVAAAGGVASASIDVAGTSTTCGTCHTTQKVGGTVPASPKATSTCFTCHAGGPSGSPAHPSDYMINANQTDHRAEVNNAGGVRNAKFNGIACSACHTTQKATDGNIPASPETNAPHCYSCHPGHT